MRRLLLLLSVISVCNSFGQSLIIDFGNSTEKNQDWSILSDNVMGGVSKSEIEYTNNSVILSGNISLDNYGGFSSIKSKFKNFDLSAYKGVKLRFKSSNQKFAFTLENSRNWTLPNFKSEFSAKLNNTWEEVVMYFKDFKEIIIGQETGNEMEINKLKNILRLGIMTNEKKVGPFSIEVEYIEFFN